MYCPTRDLHTMLFRICEFVELDAGKVVLSVSDRPTSAGIVILRDTNSTERLGKVLFVEGAVHQVEDPQTKPEGLHDTADITDIPHNPKASTCTR